MMTDRAPLRLLTAILGPSLLACAAAWAQPRERQAAPPSELAVRAEAETLAAVRDVDYERALLILDRARSEGLTMGLYHLFRANVFAAQQDAENEEKQLRAAVHYDPTLAEVYLRLASMRLNGGLWLEACDLYRQAIATVPDDLRSYVRLADVLKDHERNNSAIQILRDAVGVDPSNAAVLVSLAALFEHVGDLDRSRREYRKAARFAKGPQRLDALVKVGDLSARLADHVTAFAYYRSAISEGKHLTVALYKSAAVACDNAAWQLYEPVWQSFNAYVGSDPGAPEREDAYLSVQRGAEAVGQVMAFLDGLDPPGEVATEHAVRNLQNSLLHESIVSMASHLDTGDSTLSEAAKDRRTEAMAQREALAAERR